MDTGLILTLIGNAIMIGVAFGALRQQIRQIPKDIKASQVETESRVKDKIADAERALQKRVEMNATKISENGNRLTKLEAKIE